MLCCRKRPPSPNEKQEKQYKPKSPPRESSPANGHGAKAKTPPPSAVVKPEEVVLEESKPVKVAAAPARAISPPKSPQEEAPSPIKGSPTKAPSPVRESPVKVSAAPADLQASPPVSETPRSAGVVGQTKAPSPVRSPQQADAISDLLQRLESISDTDELLKEGKVLLAEAKDRRNAGGLDSEMSSNLDSLISRLEAVTTRLESVANQGGGASQDELATTVAAYDEILSGPFATFMEKSNQIGGEVLEQANIVNEAFRGQREFLVMVSKAKQPEMPVLQKLLAPTVAKIQEIQEYRERRRGSKHFNHLSVISEGIPALGWVTVSPTPAPYVKEMLDAVQFYSNRVLKEYKETDTNHVEWARAWTKMLGALQSYVKELHTTGLTWNKQGVDVSTLTSGAAQPGAPAPPPPPAAAPAPPPPPPPMPMPAAAEGADEDSARNALFAELNQGTDITKSLRKVKDEEKTHKNKALRLASPIPYKPASASSPKPVAAAKAVVKKPPKLELEGKKWIVEYQEGNKNMVIDDVNMKQQVYVFRCVNSTLQVKGKVNSIVLDSCKKTAVVFDSVVSAFEAVNCQSVQAQVTGLVPTISVDKTDGFQLYLNEASLNAEIVTAKSSEINILTPTESGDMKEQALPEQFKSVWDGSKFVTVATDIIG